MTGVIAERQERSRKHMVFGLDLHQDVPIAKVEKNEHSETAMQTFGKVLRLSWFDIVLTTIVMPNSVCLTRTRGGFLATSATITLLCVGALLGGASSVEAAGTAYTYNWAGGMPYSARTSPLAACQVTMEENQAAFESQYPGPGVCIHNECVSCAETVCEVIRFGPSFQICPSDWSPFHTFVGMDRTAISTTAARNSNIPSFCPAGNPINQGTGNKFESENDYVGTGPFPLRFDRYYNSLGIGVGSKIGAWWTHSFSQSINQRTESGTRFAVLTRPEGNVHVFQLVSGQWISDADVNFRLSELAGNAGWSVTTPDEQVESYDAVGKLVSMTNREGLSQTFTYNAYDQLTGVQDAFGRTLVLGYDAFKRLSTITDPAGGHIQFGYANASFAATVRLQSVTYADGKMKTYLYNEPNLYSGSVSLGQSYLTGILDELGQRFASFSYTLIGQAISTERAGGAGRTTIVYNADGTSTVTDSLGASRSYAFQNVFGVVHNTSIVGPAGPSCGPALKTLDVNGNVASQTDWNGNRTNYGYDLARNLETLRTEGLTSAGATTPQTRTITTEWHPSSRLVKRTAEPLRITTYVYNGDGGASCGFKSNGVTLVPRVPCSKTVHATTDTAGTAGFSATLTGTPRTWSYTYNANGQVLTQDGPRTDVADVTTYTYYANDDAELGKRGNVATIANAASHVTSITAYNAHGQPLTIVDPNGLTTTLTYDARQRLKTRAVGTELTTYDYDNVGQLTKVTLPDGSFLSYSHDNAHRLTGIQDNLGNRIAYTLDFAGNRTQEQVFDPASQLAQTRSRVYSNLNRLTQEIGAQGQTTAYGYDNQGNLTSIDGPLAGTVDVTTNTYDALNRLIRVTDPNAGQVNYGYNGLDQLASVRDPRNLVTTYSYDGLNNLNQQASPDTGATVNAYDPAGNPISKTDARNITANYSYDALNRVTQIVYPDQIVTFTYDQGANGLGRLTQITDRTGNTTWDYDQKARVIRKQQTIYHNSAPTIPRVLVTGYSYDAQGRMSSMTYPSGRVVAYSYDALGRVSAVTLNGQSVVSNVQYHPFGQPRSWTMGNGQSFIRTFDADGRIASHTLGAMTRALTYDAASRITGMTHGDATLNQSIGYDNLDRVTNWVAHATVQAYTYDAVGNRTILTVGANTYPYTINATSNRLDAVAGPTARSFTYDAAGNETRGGAFVYGGDGRLSEVGGGRKAGINALGQLVSRGPGLLAMGGETAEIYAYDEGGRRIGDYVPGDTSAFSEYLFLGDIAVGNLQPNEAVLDGPFYMTFTGTWTVESAGEGFIGSDYSTHAAGDGTSSARWAAPSYYPAATYRIYTRWVAGGDRATNATYTVTHSGGTTAVAVNQRLNGGQWNHLGTFSLVPAQGHDVTLTDLANGGVVADAVKLVRDDLSAATFYVHPDQINTPRVVVDSANQIVWRWDHADPFGNTTPVTTVVYYEGNHPFKLRFPGQYFDKETGNHYNMERDYDPAIGRYVQSDPIGIAWDVNLYAYVRNNPLSFSDSIGLGPSDKTFGLPRDFWNWYHRQVKKPGDPDLTKEDARELLEEWKSQGKPGPDKKGKQRLKLPKGTSKFCAPLLIFEMVQEYCKLNPADPACLFAIPPDPRDPCKGDPFCA